MDTLEGGPCTTRLQVNGFLIQYMGLQGCPVHRLEYFNPRYRKPPKMDPKLSQIPISKILSPKPYTILKGVLLRLLGLGLLTFSIGLLGSISSWAPKIHASRESSHIGVILRLYRDYIGIMEKKMDTSTTTISGLAFIPDISWC